MEAQIKALFDKAAKLRTKADSFAHVDACRIADILAEAAEYESKAFNLMTLS